MSDIFEQLRAPFPRDRIHWRAQSVTKDGKKAMALAYIDARDVRERLNAAVGPANWQCEHYECGGGRLGCRLSIRIDGEWISKTDGAGETAVEAEKGAFSTALKRAGVAWGIGEYLYDMPAPWVPCESRQYNGKYQWTKWLADPWSLVQGAPAGKPTPKQSARNQDDTTAKMIEAVNHAATYEALQTLINGERWKADAEKIPDADKERLRALVKSRMRSLSQSPFGEAA